jgi:hypothetical protein
MSTWIEMPETLLAEALSVIAEKDGSGTVNVPMALIDGLIEFLESYMDCDHEQGFCGCHNKELMIALAYALEGYMECPECEGYGTRWYKDKEDQALRKIASQRNLSVREAHMWAVNIGIAGELGEDTCKHCSGRKKVRFRD